MKKHIKKITVFLSISLICFLSCAPKYYVYASEPAPDQSVTSNDSIVKQLYNYLCAAHGAVNRGIDNVTKLPSTIENAVKEQIAGLLNGGGIYVDSNGDYVFSDGASQQIFNAMQSNSNTDARVVSDFSNFNFNADGYVNGSYVVLCNSGTDWAKTQNATSDYLVTSMRYYYNSSPNYIYTSTIWYDLSNFSFLSFANSSPTCRFFNSGGTSYSPKVVAALCRYDTGSGNYYTTSFMGGSYYAPGCISLVFPYQGRFGIGELKFVAPDGVTSYKDSFYNTFPLYSGTAYYDSSKLTVISLNIYCNNSVILSKDVASGNGVANQTNGVYVNSGNIGTVNKTQVENNNWETIYTNYVSNVNIDYQENTGMSASDFRKIQKKYTNQIIEAIQSGSENIEESISVSNRYLQAISVDVRNIIDWLNANGGGSGGGSDGGGLTTEQYNTLITALNQIQLNTDPSNYQIEQILRYLNSIDVDVEDVSEISETLNGLTDGKEQYLNYLTYLAATNSVVRDLATDVQNMAFDLNEIKGKIGKSGGGNTITAPPKIGDDLIEQLMNLAEGEIDDQVATLAIIGDVIQMCVPFCYLAVFGGILEAFAVEPETPEFEFEVSGGILSQTEDGKLTTTIDLSWVDPIRPYFIALEEIAFIVALMSLSFRVFRTFGALFS